MKIVGGLAILSIAYALTQASLPTLLLWLSLVGGFALGWWGPRWFWPLWLGLTLSNLLIALAVPALPYGLIGNANAFGIAFAVGLAAALVYWHWWAVPGLLIGVGYSASRTAFIGMGVAAFLALLRRFPATAICLALLSILGALLISEGRGSSFEARLGIWEDTLTHLTLWGHGLGSFAETYASWPLRRAPALTFAPHAYNDALQLIFELGLLSIPLFLLVILAFEAPDPKAKIVCVTFMVCSLTHFPLQVPGLGVAFAFALGTLAKGAYYGKMDAYRTALPQRQRHGVGVY